MASEEFAKDATWFSESESVRTADLKALGAFIRQRRQALGLTQTQLGDRLEWVQERISLLENGKYGLPSLPALARIASALETSLSAVIHAAGYEDISADLEQRTEEQPQTAVLWLYTLEHLLSLEASGMQQVLNEASDWIVQALQADKIDVFLFEPASQSLVAVGTSNTPMGRKQHEIGMNRLQIANGGKTARAYTECRTICDGRIDEDPDELRGLVDGLGIRSLLAVPIVIDGASRGVVSAVSAERDRFSQEDVRFFEIIGRWIALIAHREELLSKASAS